MKKWCACTQYPYEGLTVVDTEGNVTFLSAEMNDG